MAGGNFMHRVMSYLVNELVVNGLANRYLLLLYIKHISRFSHIFMLLLFGLKRNAEDYGS